MPAPCATVQVAQPPSSAATMMPFAREIVGTVTFATFERYRERMEPTEDNAGNAQRDGATELTFLLSA